MAKLPLILSIVALIAATGLGIAAKQKADQKMRELAAKQIELKQTVSTLDERRRDLGKANESLAASTKEVEAKTAEVAKLTGDVKSGEEKLAAATTAAKTQDEKLAKLETEGTEMKVKLEAELIAKTTLESQLVEAKKEIDEKRQAILALQSRNKQADEHVDSVKPAGPVGPSPTLTGTVRAVNGGLNFLVLSVGDRQGVSVNTSMLVVRGGQRVATLKVTSIEPRESIAEVVPGTLARGQSVQVGDQVVLVRGERKSGGVPTKGGRTVPPVEPALPEA